MAELSREQHVGGVYILKRMQIGKRNMSVGVKQSGQWRMIMKSYRERRK